jgi:transposase
MVWGFGVAEEVDLLGRKDRSQMTLFIPGSLDRLIPDDHILKKVDRVVDFTWLADEVRDRYCPDNGRPGIDPECALRLMLAGFFHGIVHDRKLLREAQVNLAIRWFAGYGLDEELPHHSSLGVIRERWGAERFKQIFQRTVAMCAKAAGGTCSPAGVAHAVHSDELRGWRSHRLRDSYFQDAITYS